MNDFLMVKSTLRDPINTSRRSDLYLVLLLLLETNSRKTSCLHRVWPKSYQNGVKLAPMPFKEKRRLLDREESGGEEDVPVKTN
jgi:hypothetical protein